MFPWLLWSFLLFSCTSRCRFKRCCPWCWSSGFRCRSGSQSRDRDLSFNHRGFCRWTNCNSGGKIWSLGCSWCWCCHCFGICHQNNCRLFLMIIFFENSIIIRVLVYRNYFFPSTQNVSFTFRTFTAKLQPTSKFLVTCTKLSSGTRVLTEPRAHSPELNSCPANPACHSTLSRILKAFLSSDLLPYTAQIIESITLALKKEKGRKSTTLVY